MPPRTATNCRWPASSLPGQTRRWAPVQVVPDRPVSDPPTPIRACQPAPLPSRMQNKSRMWAVTFSRTAKPRGFMPTPDHGRSHDSTEGQTGGGVTVFLQRVACGVCLVAARGCFWMLERRASLSCRGEKGLAASSGVESTAPRLGELRNSSCCHWILRDNPTSPAIPRAQL